MHRRLWMLLASKAKERGIFSVEQGGISTVEEGRSTAVLGVERELATYSDYTLTVFMYDIG
jgi:hypothetical protein